MSFGKHFKRTFKSLFTKIGLASMDPTLMVAGTAAGYKEQYDKTKKHEAEEKAELEAADRKRALDAEAEEARRQKKMADFEDRRKSFSSLIGTRNTLG